MSIQKAIIQGTMAVLSALPLRLHWANAHLVGWIAMHLVRYRRKVVEENKDRSFPDPPEHFGRLVCETIWFSHTTARRMERSQIVSAVNPEESARLQSVAPGTIILAGHYANWELLFGFEHFALPEGSADSYAFKRSNVAMVYKKLNSPLWDEIFRECRLRLLGTDFENYIESAGILRHVVEHHGDGYFYMFDTDQRPYANAKAVMDVEFMGQPAQTMYAGAGVAHKYGLAVSYLSMTRKPSGKGYLCELKTICDDASKMEVQQIMDEFYRLLEADIRKDPGEYLWSHKRWKLVNKNTK